jgi:hypothetical protein
MIQRALKCWGTMASFIFRPSQMCVCQQWWNRETPPLVLGVPRSNFTFSDAQAPIGNTEGVISDHV